MGEGQSPSGVTIELYKHRNTRRYLNIAAAGHKHRFEHDRHEAWLHRGPLSPMPLVPA